VRKFDNLLLYILWRIDPFLGNDRETNSKTTAVARQQILTKQQLNYNTRGTAGNGVFCGPRRGRCYAAPTATLELQQWKNCVFCVVRVEGL
jgi:hypothetical protein